MVQGVGLLDWSGCLSDEPVGLHDTQRRVSVRANPNLRAGGASVRGMCAVSDHVDGLFSGA